MFKKGYIAIFAILLAVAGIGFMPTYVPNQEIVVQFSQGTSNDESDTAIAQFREQLAKLGVEDVQILRREDGTLKISYYSEIDVTSIQESFARQQGGLFSTSSNNSGFPKQEGIDAYFFTVSEIGAGDTDIYNGLNGHVLEVETKTHRFYPPSSSFTAASSGIKKEIKLTKLSELIYSQQSVVVTITSRLLPETRAGPIV